ncbi:hypothetical protein [Collinsella bouchesdurhonensis]|uniref:hypothetical protein n=1 Tax=Collinsella bouchesdurhonensis TaxID=1907654 RepID=UPI003569E808
MSENENMELDETIDMVEQAEVEAEVATTEDADVEAAPADAEVAEDDEVVEAAEGQTAPEDLDDKLFDKVNRAARLLRNRRGALAQEAEAEADRRRDLQRALKLLELKPKMEQKEMAELMGMGLRDLNAILAEAEKLDIVARIEPEEPDMRKVVVMASEDAEELIAAQAKKRKKLVPQISADSVEQLLALLDQVIDPLVEMGLDDDRGPRGGRDDRRGGDRSHGSHGAPRMGFSGGRGGDRGGRGGFGGDRGGRGGFGDRDRGGDRGGRGGFGGRDDRRGGDRGGRGGFGGDRGGRGGFGGGRDDRRGGNGGGFRGNRGGRFNR